VKAVLSDIHGNLEALQAVVADLRRFPIEAVYCLGNVLGRLPNPWECLDIAMGWDVVLQGEHEFEAIAALGGAAPSAGASRQSPNIHPESWNQPIPEDESAVRRRQFLAGLPQIHEEGSLRFVHGSPRRPLHEYIFPEDIYNARKLERIFKGMRMHCFAGKTHLPGVFTDELRFMSPEELPDGYRLDGRKAIVNVGSVGQPRDGDWRACYVLFDGDTVRFRRVKYDIDATLRKLSIDS
jgi:diadenosine tetraphosphatase ApaH/serine/threonine PP2A family protein phosphatase